MGLISGDLLTSRGGFIGGAPTAGCGTLPAGAPTEGAPGGGSPRPGVAAAGRPPRGELQPARGVESDP